MHHHLLFAIVATVWGFSFLLMKLATLAFPPLTLAGWRVAGGAAMLGLVAWLVKRRWRPRGRQWLQLLPIVVAGYLVPFCVQPFLIERYATSFVGLLPSLVPLFTMGTALVLLRTGPTPMQVLGVGGGLVCVICIFADGLDRSVGWSHLLLGLSVPAGYAVGNTLVKRRFADVPVVPFTAWCLLLSGIVLLPLGHLSETIRPQRLLPASLALAGLGMVSTGVVLGIFYFLIQRRGPLYASMVTYLIPLGALFWGWVVGERISLLQFGAVAGVILMVVLTQRRPGRRGARAASA